MHDIISAEVDRLMEEAGGDGWIALRLAVYERLAVSGMVSSGFARVKPCIPSAPPKERVEALDIPQPESPEATAPHS